MGKAASTDDNEAWSESLMVWLPNHHLMDNYFIAQHVIVKISCTTHLWEPPPNRKQYYSIDNGYTYVHSIHTLGKMSMTELGR